MSTRFDSSDHIHKIFDSSQGVVAVTTSQRNGEAQSLKEV